MEKLIFPEINLSGVKGVLLDIDNTIYHYESCHNYALNILLSQLSTIVSNSKKEVEEVKRNVPLKFPLLCLAENKEPILKAYYLFFLI